jgi:alpha-L-fucosidase 2
MAKNTSNILQFNMPASWWGEKWREGLYVGNGKIGANVYGGVSDELILINNSALSWQGRIGVVPDVSVKLRELRKKMDASDFIGAQSVLPNALAAKNFRAQAEYPLPLVNLAVHFDNVGVVTNFRRVLDMERAEAEVSYQINGTKYFRNLFVSRENDLVVYEITKGGAGLITATFSLDLPRQLSTDTADGKVSLPEGVSKSIDKQCMCFAARNDDGTDYGVVARIVPVGGVVRTIGDTLFCSGASSILVLVDSFVASVRQREWTKRKAKLNSLKDSYDKMLRPSAATHNKLFSSISLELDADDADIEQLIYEANGGNIRPLLLEKMCKFGRYLHVLQTHTSGSTLSPVGLWNGTYLPYRAFNCYGGEFQSSFLHVFAGNLAQNLEEIFDTFAAKMGDFENNAMRLYGCRGILIPAVCSPTTGRLGSVDSFAIHFTGAGGWLCNLFMKYARYSQDTKFLKNKLLPFMKQVALFYEDFFTEKNGELTSSPSAMPMRIGDSHRVIGRPVVAKNSALDFAIARDFFRNIVEACILTNSNRGDIDRYTEYLTKIPKAESSSEGILKEFVNSIISVDYTGVSVGTLYPAYFGSEVDIFSPVDDIELYERTADKKLTVSGSQNSYYMAILANTYAHLGNSFKAKQCLSNIVRASLMSNLVAVDKDWRGMGICGSGVWTPVQMQTNLAVTNAVQEMLLYSKGDKIAILPAAPSDWKNVSFSGLMTENGTEVALDTDPDKGVLNIELISHQCDVMVDLFLPKTVKKIIKCSVKELTKLSVSTADQKSINQIRLEQNKPFNIQLKYMG